MTDFPKDTQPGPVPAEVIEFGKAAKPGETCPEAGPMIDFSGLGFGDGPQGVHARSNYILETMLHRYVMVTGRTPCVVDLKATKETGGEVVEMGKDSFILHADTNYGDLQFLKNGELTKPIAAGHYFWNMKGLRRITVQRMVFEPTLEPYNVSGHSFNWWHSLKATMCKPDMSATREDIQPLVDHLLYISDGDSEGVDYFMNWLATLYQRPGIKIPSAIMFYSRIGRIGKSMLYKILAPVFGPAMVDSLKGEELHSKWLLDIVQRKRLIVWNELSKHDRADGYESLKSFISEDKLTAEGKNIRHTGIGNHVHSIITTNNADCLPLMQGDGRILVMRCEAERKPDIYYQKLAAWMTGPGPSLLAGVLAQWDFPADWDPYAPVPQTAATVRTQAESRNPLAGWFAELIEEGKTPFDVDFDNVDSLIEKLDAIYPAQARAYKLNSKTIPAALTLVGAVLCRLNYYDKGAGKTKTVRRWIWRNRDQWVMHDGDDWKPRPALAEALEGKA